MPLSRGSAPPPAPATALNWTGQAAGTGTVTLRWPVRSGNWMLVVMNRDASAGVTVQADSPTPEAMPK